MILLSSYYNTKSKYVTAPCQYTVPFAVITVAPSVVEAGTQQDYTTDHHILELRGRGQPGSADKKQVTISIHVLPNSSCIPLWYAITCETPIKGNQPLF